MEICKLDFMYALDKFERTFNSTKFNLGRLDVLVIDT